MDKFLLILVGPYLSPAFTGANKHVDKEGYRVRYIGDYA
jgi:hypothetical protein